MEVIESGDLIIKCKKRHNCVVLQFNDDAEMKAFLEKDSVSYTLILFDDDSIKQKVTFLCPQEAIDFLESFPIGSSIRVTFGEDMTYWISDDCDQIGILEQNIIPSLQLTFSSFKEVSVELTHSSKDERRYRIRYLDGSKIIEEGLIFHPVKTPMLTDGVTHL